MINDCSSFTRWNSKLLVQAVGFNNFFVLFKCNWWFQVVNIRVTSYYNTVLFQVLCTIDSNGARLNYTTTHHDPPWPTTTHHQPKHVHHRPPPPTTSQNMSTTTHHHPTPAKIYPPLPTISQKMDRHPTKAKIYSYITSLKHCFNSSFFFEMQYSFPWWRFCVIKFWSVRFSNSKFLLHSVLFTIFKIF